MEAPKDKKLGKMYGNPQFGSGPKRGMGDQAAAAGNGSKGTFKTGPASMDMSGHKAKGPGLDESGTERAEKGEDGAGSASGKRGNVKD